jgi:hypothetical protein
VNLVEFGLCLIDIIIGELEVTFTRTFCQGGNLRALMTSNAATLAFDELRAPFKQHFSNVLTRNLLHDLIAADSIVQRPKPFTWEDGKQAVDLPDDIHHSLTNHIYSSEPSGLYTYSRLPHMVQKWKKIEWNGTTYSTSRFNKKNAHIHYRPSSSSETRAAQIQEIFVHRRRVDNDWMDELFCAVQPFRQLSRAEGLHDIYRKHPLLDIRLYHNQLGPLMIISPNDIVSHVAVCSVPFPSIGNDIVVVQSLDRVCSTHFNLRICDH